MNSILQTENIPLTSLLVIGGVQDTEHKMMDKRFQHQQYNNILTIMHYMIICKENKSDRLMKTAS